MAFILIVQECLKGLKDRSDLGSLVQATLWRPLQSGEVEGTPGNTEPAQCCFFGFSPPAVRLTGALFSRL